MTSLRTRSTQDERMDAEDLPQETYSALIADLAKVNSVTLSRRPTLAFLKRALGKRKHFRLLDVGFGHGDMLRAIAGWAKRRGIAAELVGIDLNPRSEVAARAATPPDMRITYGTGDYAILPDDGFDIIISSLVAHHMTEAQLIRFLRFMEAEARVGWMVNDLLRHRLAHFGFPIIARAMRWHEIVRHDGQLSIARGFRPDEWPPLLAAAGILEAHVVRRFPFRLCVERTR
jgi:2-polyprenyl-3-methyl-5-hydroxy-6-metoxy-1,4-benzoquinol methylase